MTHVALMGARTAFVALTNSPGHFVRVALEDLRRLEGRGLGGAWFLNGNGGRSRFVRTRRAGSRHLVQVARLITEAGPGEIVRYRDGDRLNLTRENLALVQRAQHRADRTHRD